MTRTVGHQALETDAVGDNAPPPSRLHTDAALLAASVQEPDLFALVYERHAEGSFQYAALRLGAELAQDAVADAVLTAFQLRHRYDPEYPNARAWLLGILTRTIHRHRRTERTRYRALARAYQEPTQDGEDPTQRLVEQITTRSVNAPLARALAGLAGRDRDVLLLIARKNCPTTRSPKP